jgi:hypothetical protein
VSYIWLPAKAALTIVADRIAGAKSEINSLVDSINRGGMPITSSTDIYAVCDMVKLWMRQLPDSVIPGAFYSRAIAVGGTSRGLNIVHSV